MPWMPELVNLEHSGGYDGNDENEGNGNTTGLEGNGEEVELLDDYTHYKAMMEELMALTELGEDMTEAIFTIEEKVWRQSRFHPDNILINLQYNPEAITQDYCCKAQKSLRSMLQDDKDVIEELKTLEGRMDSEGIGYETEFDYSMYQRALQDKFIIENALSEEIEENWGKCELHPNNISTILNSGDVSYAYIYDAQRSLEAMLRDGHDVGELLRLLEEKLALKRLREAQSMEKELAEVENVVGTTGREGEGSIGR